MKHKLHLILIAAIAIFYFAADGFADSARSDGSFLGYGQSFKRDSTNVSNAIYHWRTTFNPDSTELSFLRRHNVKRLYIRMFDVEYGEDYTSKFRNVTPTATTKFESAIPEGIEIVPTVYITLEALREMDDFSYRYAELIVERILAMARYNNCGEIREIQFDCDWTATTRHIFVSLCREAKEHLQEKGIELSCTVRLHQLREMAPPVDRAVLMLYNTGGLKSLKTRNSILDVKDVVPYLRNQEMYEIPLDLALPTFGWGVKFRDGKFDKIVADGASDSLKENEYIRWERPTIEEILFVRQLAERVLGQSERGNILYHLDYSQLSNYTDDEITKLYSFN